MAVPTVQSVAPLFVGEPRQMYTSLRRAWEQFVADGSVATRDPVRSFILERRQWCVDSCVDPRKMRASQGLGADDIASMLRHDDFAMAGSRVLNDFGLLRVRFIPVAYHERFIGTVLIVRSFENRLLGLLRFPGEDSLKPSGDGTPGLFIFDDRFGTSPAIREVVWVGRPAAKSGKNVLLTGDTGSGKKLLAQAIHSAGWRSSGPFVAINCAAIPSGLVESELFGYAPGAFTGARRHGASGQSKQANGGTIFLDEVSAMPLALQEKLLRAVENRALSKLGGNGAVPFNVRIIATSNENVRGLIEQGRLRRGLYYRLNVLGIPCPSLRGRMDDVILLASLFLARECRPKGRQTLSFIKKAEPLKRPSV